jgi:hypothetical protein
MTAISRSLAVSIFANETSTTAKEVREVPWSKIIEEHKRRRIRPDKSGVMLGAYKLVGTRANDNVPFRSLIQLDIDTEGDKEKATGRIVRVTRQAPPLDHIRAGIETYEWIAASSHSHGPQRGIIKYRITILPDRDILPDEWKPLLEALDELLRGALDRGAWPLSQAFYLPSCPAENEGDAFFEHNEGVPLPVDEFVRRGREIIATKLGDRAALTMRGQRTGNEISDHDFSPSSALRIISKCPTLAHVADVGGAVGERLWRSMLGVVKYTSEGGALCHEWSKGDPRYDPEETQKKIDRWMKGPTLCSTFREISDARCQGCPQRCKSPIQLGHADDADPMKVAMRELDLRYFVARVGGNVLVFDEEDQNILSDAMRFTAFQQLHAGRKINGKSVAAAWLNSSGRRTYSSLAFDPSGRCDKDSYNTWRGLAVEPKPGQCAKIFAHIREIWCGGDAAQFEYVLNWLALLVQKPWIKPEVALVLRSRQGAGKTIIIEMLLTIFGPHGFTTAQKEQVAGRFSGHLFDKVLVVLEEAFFAGDPAAVAAAKALITNPTFGYEAKGKDAFSAPNYAHVITLTNNEWAVHAGADARRWMALDVSEARMRDHTYFAALASEIEAGGREAFLDYLMSINLNRWNPRAVPRSDALHTQQVETLKRSDPVAAWWLEALSEGEFTVEGGAVAWAAKRMRELLPAGALSKTRKSHSGGRFFHYRLPDLQSAREHFKAVTGVDPCAA